MTSESKNRYVVKSLFGAGGQGEVYAFDSMDDFMAVLAYIDK